MTLPLIVIGGGGHARVLIETLQLQSSTIIGYTEINPVNRGELLLGVRCLGDDEEILKYKPSDIRLINGLGSTGEV